MRPSNRAAVQTYQWSKQAICTDTRTRKKVTGKGALMSVGLVVILLLGGCGGADRVSQEETAEHTSPSFRRLQLSPTNDSGVVGSATFSRAASGTRVHLELRGLPKPNTFYLAHIHPGTCAKEEGHEPGASGHEHGASSHEHGAEIEYPLSQVKSDAEGHGSSTTTLREISVEMLFSGALKHVNVHEAGSGNPPILACADLKRAG
jgi:Cu/Zn superoxide dismutase